MIPMATLSRSLRAACALVAALLTPFAAMPAAAGPTSPNSTAATAFRETFTNATNEGLWTFGNPADTIQSTGGNPGWWLENDFLDTFAPQARTTYGVSSKFTGNYRERGVNGLLADVEVNHVDFSAAERPLSLILFSDGNGPGTADDCSIYMLGTSDIPLPDTGWKHFKFQVPSTNVFMPSGWGILNGCADLTENQAWDKVITDVDQLTFFFGDPTLFFIFQMWDVGLDNPGIRTNP